MRHFTVTSAFEESALKSNRTGTPASVHCPNACLMASRNAGLKFAAWVEANHTRMGVVWRFSHRRSIESPLASSISPMYVVEPLDRMRRRVSERARSSMYEGSRPFGPAGTAVPWEVVVGVEVCGGGGFCGPRKGGGSAVRRGASHAESTGRGGGREAS